MKFNPKMFKMGYFILYRHDGRGWFGNQIVKRQKEHGFDDEEAQYTHVEVSGGGIHSVNIAPPQSKFVEITKKHKGRHVCLMRYKNKDYLKKGRYKVSYFSATLANKSYDIRGVLSFLIKWIKQDNRLFFCSEGATWALQKEFPQALNGLPPSDIMPADFFDHHDFEKVWEGDIIS